jgi:hypothetical protein
MKRRKFIQTLATTPALAVVPVAEAQQPTPSNRLAESQMPKLEIAVADVAATTAQKFFNAQQFAALRKLSDLLMPALNGLPGALEAGVPEFLDFLVGASPAERKQIYTAGLDLLNAQATKRFKKVFAELEDKQAGELLAPLRQTWTYIPPTEPLARFLREAKADVRNATINSREYVKASSAGSRRAGGMGQYWYPID